MKKRVLTYLFFALAVFSTCVPGLAQDRTGCAGGFCSIEELVGVGSVRNLKDADLAALFQTVPALISTIEDYANGKIYAGVPQVTMSVGGVMADFNETDAQEKIALFRKSFDTLAGEISSRGFVSVGGTFVAHANAACSQTPVGQNLANMFSPSELQVSIAIEQDEFFLTIRLSDDEKREMTFDGFIVNEAFVILAPENSNPDYGLFGKVTGENLSIGYDGARWERAFAPGAVPKEIAAVEACVIELRRM